MTSSTLPDPDPDRRQTGPIAPPSPHAEHPAPVPATPSTDVVAEFTTFYKAALPRLVAFLRWQGVPCRWPIGAAIGTGLGREWT